MARDYLEEFVALLLVDLIRAQNRANQYSAELASHLSSAENRLLTTFPVSNSHIKACQIQLKVGLDKDLLGAQPGLAAALREAVAAALGGLPKAADSSAAQVAETVQKNLGRGPGGPAAPEDRIAEAAGQIFAELSRIAGETPTANLPPLRLDEIERMIRHRLLDGPGRRGLPVRLSGVEADAPGAGFGATLTLDIEMRDYQIGFAEPVDGNDGRQTTTTHLYRKS